MADDLTGLPAATPAVLPEPQLTERPSPAPAAPPAPRSSAYFHRFGLAYALLAVVLGLAVGGFIVLAGHATEPAGPAWSSWTPSGDDAELPTQIAAHVSGQYRFPDGAKLVGVLAGTPNVQNVPIGHYALMKNTTGTDYNFYSASNSVEYQLCGLGPSCSITSGTPTVARARLLHRQAVELALYTFKYSSSDSVVALLPPAKGKQPTFALFYRRDDLKHALSRPLGLTLPQRPMLTPGSLDQTELNRITTLTENHLFQYTFQQAPDRTVVLVLSPQPV